MGFNSAFKGLIHASVCLVQIRTFEAYVSRICDSGSDGLINVLVQSDFVFTTTTKIEAWERPVSCSVGAGLILSRLNS